jgi:hypothetical protein
MMERARPASKEEISIVAMIWGINGEITIIAMRMTVFPADVLHKTRPVYPPLSRS